MPRKISSMFKVQKAIATHPHASLQELGEILGISRQRVHQVITERNLEYESKLGCFLPTIPKQEFISAIKKGMIQKYFKKQHNISQHIFHRHLAHYNLTWPPSKNGMEKVDLTELKTAIKKHPKYSTRDLAEHFGVSRSAIIMRINYCNLPYKRKTRWSVL